MNKAIPRVIDAPLLGKVEKVKNYFVKIEYLISGFQIAF